MRPKDFRGHGNDGLHADLGEHGVVLLVTAHALPHGTCVLA